ncbi:hypothetical protein YWS52_32530 [Chitiniphilus shinanonensis]
MLRVLCVYRFFSALHRPARRRGQAGWVGRKGKFKSGNTENGENTESTESTEKITTGNSAFPGFLVWGFSVFSVFSPGSVSTGFKPLQRTYSAACSRNWFSAPVSSLDAWQ